jgi:chaperone modulatory protein CbpM
MSEEEIIPIEIYCSYYQVEQTFLDSLESHGLITISFRENRRYIPMNEIVELEKYTRMYYDLNINVPGIDALKNMLEKIKELQHEAEALRARLRIYE